MGVEPTRPAWKAGALPLSYARVRQTSTSPRSPRLGRTAFVLRGRARRFNHAALPAAAASLRRAKAGGWAEEDSNLRRLCHQIYSLVPLTARESARVSAVRPSGAADGNPSRGTWRLFQNRGGAVLAVGFTDKTLAGQRVLPVLKQLLSQPGICFSKAASLEPAVRIELTTCGLQNHCSAFELRWPYRRPQMRIVNYTTRLVFVNQKGRSFLLVSARSVSLSWLGWGKR